MANPLSRALRGVKARIYKLLADLRCDIFLIRLKGPFVNKFFIKLRHIVLMASVLMLIGCKGKLEPKEFFEVKIDGKIQKLNDDEISNFLKYRNSICKVSEYFEIKITEESPEFIDEKIKPQKDVVTTTSSTLIFNIKDLKISIEKILLERDIKVINNKDLSAFDDVFLALEKIKNNWVSADIYLSDTSSFDNLKNFKEYSYSKMHLERGKVVCESQLSAKK